MLPKHKTLWALLATLFTGGALLAQAVVGRDQSSPGD
jgi:hypothetical protein